MSNERHFGVRILWSEEDGGYVAASPDLPGVSAFGDTPAEAAVELAVALDLAVQELEERGRPVPEPRGLISFSGQFRVRLPVSLHAWLADEADREGTSLNTLVVQLLSEARGTRTGLCRSRGHAGPALTDGS